MDILSNWSSFTQISVTGAITAPTGEKLALNGTGDGVLVWYTDPYDNVGKLMAVALANQRTTGVWSDKATDVSDVVNVADGAYDPNTAKHNTDAIIDFYSDYLGGIYIPAANACRGYRISGAPCNMPNKQQLDIIRKVRNIIDELDHTAESNPTYKLSNWGFGTTGDSCWSSSEFNGTHAWSAFTTDTPGSNIFATAIRKTRMFGIISVLELNPSTMEPI